MVVDRPVRFNRNTNFNPIYLRDMMIKLLKDHPEEEDSMTTTDLAPVATQKFKPVEVDLDHLKPRMERLAQARKDRDILAAFIEMEEKAIKDELSKLKGTDGRIDGVVVVTHRPIKQYRFAEFAENYPDIYNSYLEPTIVDKLNKDRLVKDHAALLEPFRSTAFKVA